ncbi:MAG TPA: hypothetical protein VFB38_00770 [Chthonomonadaceae bacterium]|nr:hypothetical protein [Chthonomonadaceae bacterium]
MIQVTKTNLNFEREPLVAPFGFKGGYVTDIWQVAALMESRTGKQGVGVGVHGVLWSDAKVFAGHPDAVGNALMLLMTSHALQAAQEIPFTTPPELLERLLPLTYEYGKQITENPDLRLTFALNSLVPVDNAAWLLYAAENGIVRFDDLIPPDVRPALAHRHPYVVAVPVLGYGVAIEDIVGLVDEGYYLLKIKIGSDPDKDGDQEKMLEFDKRRIGAIHEALKHREVAGAAQGHVLYYLDANGRYESKERLLRLLDHADKIGALEWTVLLEEPFPEEAAWDVRDIPARVVADESAHSDREALERIHLGYGAIALKPIAKTLSMSFRVAKLAHEHGVPCFCADLTVNPVMIEWNKNVAARLAPLPGMPVGVLEANGFQNYRNWQTMQTYHPCPDAPWTQPARGAYPLGEDFYTRSGCIFTPGKHYASLVGGKTNVE